MATKKPAATNVRSIKTAYRLAPYTHHRPTIDSPSTPHRHTIDPPRTHHRPPIDPHRPTIDPASGRGSNVPTRMECPVLSEVIPRKELQCFFRRVLVESIPQGISVRRYTKRKTLRQERCRRCYRGFKHVSSPCLLDPAYGSKSED